MISLSTIAKDAAASLRVIAKDAATSDAGKVFGYKKLPKDANNLSTIEILGENGLRLSHWIPGVGTITGLVSLGLLAYRVSNKKRPNDEDIAELARCVLAITGSTLALIPLDIAATYLRKNTVSLDDLVDQLTKLSEKSKPRTPKSEQVVQHEEVNLSSFETMPTTEPDLSQTPPEKPEVEQPTIRNETVSQKADSVRSIYDGIKDIDPWKN